MFVAVVRFLFLWMLTSQPVSAISTEDFSTPTSGNIHPSTMKDGTSPPIKPPSCSFKILDDFGSESGLILWNSAIVFHHNCRDLSGKRDEFFLGKQSYSIFAEEFDVWNPPKFSEEPSSTEKLPDFNGKLQNTNLSNLPSTSTTKPPPVKSVPMNFPYRICDGHHFDCTVPYACPSACKIGMNGKSGCLRREDCRIHDHPFNESPWKLCDMSNPRQPRAISWCEALLENITGTVEVKHVTDCDRFHNFFTDSFLNDNLGETFEIQRWPIILHQASLPEPPSHGGDNTTEEKWIPDPRVSICLQSETCKDFLYFHCQIETKDEEGNVTSIDAQYATQTKFCSGGLQIDLRNLSVSLEEGFPRWNDSVLWRLMCSVEKVLMGCVFHGCEKCFPNNREKKVPGSSLSLEDAYIRTVQRAKIIRDQGIELVEVWECEVRKELKENSEMETFFRECDVKDPLDPRMAFYGGRTSSHCLIYEVKEGEKIHYVDVMSLYPFINKWSKYPIGHPKIITEGFHKLTRGHQPYFGLIYCKVQPPKTLEIPVLPGRDGPKLFFVLCKTCLGERNQDSCSHTREGRSLTGVWCSNEIDEALEQGYTVEEVYEVWHYPESAQYDGKDPNTGLFTGYINHFLKHKVEASGWPPGTDQSEESKKDFVKRFSEREGVQLDGGNMKKNPGIRSQAKLCLNSFWGKFGQRSNMMNGTFFKDPALFMKLVTDPTNIIHQVTPLGGEDAEMVYVSHTKEEEFVDVLPNTNVVLAAFTTASARLKLYSYLKRLGYRVLYMDTDSIVYKTGPGDIYEPEVGCFLGDMTDELRGFGEGAYIDQFIGAGPKNYAFRVRKPDGSTESVVKIRGFSLNHTTAKTLNLECMKEKVLEFLREGVSEPTRIVGPRIERRKDREVVTVVKKKDYRVVYDKRRILKDGSTLPYGYVD